MQNPLTQQSWSPSIVGAGIGVLSWFAFATADQPIGITTAFEHTAALAEKAVMPSLEHTNTYDKEQASIGEPPKIGWEWMLVIGVLVGPMLSSFLSGERLCRNTSRFKVFETHLSLFHRCCIQ